MPKPRGIKLAHRRALNRIQVAGVLPPAPLRLAAGQWVRTLRVGLRMTQRELAARARVSQAHLAQIERGLFEPRLGTLRSLFDALHCDMLVLPAPRRRIGDLVAERLG